MIRFTRFTCVLLALFIFILLPTVSSAQGGNCLDRTSCGCCQKVDSTRKAEASKIAAQKALARKEAARKRTAFVEDSTKKAAAMAQASTREQEVFVRKLVSTDTLPTAVVVKGQTHVVVDNMPPMRPAPAGIQLPAP